MIQYKEIKNKHQPYIVSIIYIILTSILLSSFQVDWLLILLNGFLVSIVVCVRNKKWYRHFVMSVILLAVILSGKIVECIVAFVNNMTKRIELLYGIDSIQFSNGSYNMYAIVVVLVLIHLIVLNYISRKGIIFSIFIYIGVLAVFQLTNIVYILASIICAVILFVQIGKVDTTTIKMKSFLFMTVLIMIISMSFIFERVEHPFQSIPQSIQTKVESLRFNLTEKSWLREGKISQTPEKVKVEGIAATVLMEEPHAMYLKGMVGATFTKGDWRSITNEQALENEGLFYWLNESEFSSSTMLAALQQSNYLKKESNMALHIVDASTKYKLTPYELANVQINSGLHKDGIVQGGMIKGERDYTYKVVNGVVQNYPKLAMILENEADKKRQNYFMLEENYRKFVYETYLKVGKDEQLILQDEFSKQSSIDYEKAIKYVQTTLKKTIKYDENTSVSNEVVATIWQTSQQGYSPHYATIATLAFRMLGIPARYVEGYMLTPELIGNSNSYEKIVIPNDAAHAWPEIYIDQLGWVPVEVTPPYLNRMPETKMPYHANSKADSKNEEVNGPQQTTTTATNASEKMQDQELPTNVQPKKEETRVEWTNILIILALILIVSLTGTIYLKIHRKRKYVRLLWQGINSEEPLTQAQASIEMVHWWFAKVLRIELENEPLENRIERLRGKISTSLLEQYNEAFLQYQAQKYGAMEPSKIMIVSQAKAQLIDSRKWTQRFCWKYVKGYY